jgi:putative transposase
MFLRLWAAFKQRGLAVLQRVQEQVRAWTKPIARTMVVGIVSDLMRSKADLVLESALLRQQLTVLDRHVKRPTFSWKDRWLMVLLSSKLPTWRQTLLIVQPDTLLRWHRKLFKRFWARKSKRKGGNHRLADEVIALIQRMARENHLWGAERLRGELRKLGWHVGKGDRSQIPPPGSTPTPTEPDLEDDPAQARRGHLGV